MRYLVVLLLTGCAAASTVRPHGTDGYFINVDDQFGLRSHGSLQDRAIDEATAHCAKQGKKMRIREASSSGSYGMSGTGVNLVFGCQ